MITAETTTVYRGGNRRWLTAQGAANAEAKRLYRLRYPCECEPASYDGVYPGFYCDNHGEYRDRFVERVSRLLLKQFRKETP